MFTVIDVRIKAQFERRLDQLAPLLSKSASACVREATAHTLSLHDDGDEAQRQSQRLAQREPQHHWSEQIPGWDDWTAGPIPRYPVATVVGSTVCGTGGCPLLIVQERPARLKPITTMGLFKQPPIVSDQNTKGWRNLISWVGWNTGTDAVLRFDGRIDPTPPELFLPPRLCRAR